MSGPVRQAASWLLLAGFGAGVFALIRLGPIQPVMVRTDSMTPSYQPGALLLVNRAGVPQVGDPVVFQPETPGGLPVFVHRLIGYRPDGALITKGDALPGPDPFTTRPDGVRGTVLVALPTQFLASPWTARIGGAALGAVVGIWLVHMLWGSRTEEGDNEAPPVERIPVHA